MKYILALSGGLDSTTVLAQLLAEGHAVDCVAFSYGSKHNPFENQAARQVAMAYHVELHEVDLSGAMRGFTSALMASGGDVPEGHYSAASMSQTVVPARNIIFLSLLAGLAWSRGCQAIALGIHQGDHAIYEDCRREFFKAMDSAIYLGTGGRVELAAPFLHTDKTGILKRGLELGVPYELTRTCYKAQPVACGKCGSCNERLEAFRLNNARDPITYE